MLHLADSRDLGLRVPQVEPQTVLELLSVAINVGVTRSPRSAQHPASQGRIWGEKTSQEKVAGTQSWESRGAGGSQEPGQVRPFSAVLEGSSGEGSVGARDYLYRIFCCSVPELSQPAQPRSLWLANAATYSGSAAANSSRGWPGAAPGHGTWTGASSGEDFQGAQNGLCRSPPPDLRAEFTCARPNPAAATAELLQGALRVRAQPPERG